MATRATNGRTSQASKRAVFIEPPVSRATRENAATTVQPDSGTQAPPSGMTPISTLLLSGPDQDLVDRDVPWPGDDVGDGVGDVRGVQPVHPGEALTDLLQDLRAVVA